MDKEQDYSVRDLTDDERNERDTLYLLGGAAMILFGAGLMLSRPIMRRYLGHVKLGNLLGTAFPDLERYLKLRAM